MKHKLPLKIILDSRGRLTVKNYEGLKAEEARQKILERLEKEGHIEGQSDLEQTVNVHERCGTPVEFYVSQQWYIRITDLKEKWLELGDKIRWYPEHMKVRYNQWVGGLNTDWCMSRQRYYGIPFPVWHCKKCGKIVPADEKELPVDPVLAKPRKCSCGGETEPDKNVMDTWATSSLTPQINQKWKEKDERQVFPFSIRPQGYEIIRTWAFYTIVKSWLHEKKIPWKDIMINGMGLDPRGRAMHKSKGNVIDPLPLIDKYSADALRYWAASATLGNDMPFQEKDVLTGQKLINKLWNASRFASLYLKGRPKKTANLAAMDKWLLSKLGKVIKEATESMKNYDYARAKATVDLFFWHTFCDDYLEFVKYRLYDKQDESACHTLYTALLNLLKLFAPFIPHVTEEAYQHLFRAHEGDKSIHVSRWPEAEWRYPEFEKDGDVAAALISSVRQWKHDNKLALNEEIQEITAKKADEKALVPFTADILAATKAKRLVFGDEFSVRQ
jgi:valyl-tRNA synthetase